MKHKNYWRRMLQGQLGRFAWIVGCVLAVFVLPLMGITEPLVRAALIAIIVVLSLQVLADFWVIAFGEWCKDMGNGLGTIHGAIRGPKKKR